MIRADGRSCGESRPVEITTGFIKFAEGSALIRCGDTVVLCNASVEDRVPPHVRPGCGWVTAEYSMLPRANRERSRRDVDKLKLSGRSAEIQRLIGRSLRAAVDMRRLGERTITVDCDVLQGDGGTRTASVTGGYVALALAVKKLMADGLLAENPIITPVAAISAGIASVTGGFVALALACRGLLEQGLVKAMPIRHYVAGISAGIVDNVAMLDLQYSEDSRAMVDLNCVMNEQGGIIELQGTGEGRAFTPREQQELVALCAQGNARLIELEKNILGEIL